MKNTTSPWPVRVPPVRWAVAALVAVTMAGGAAALPQEKAGPVQVTIKDEKPTVVETDWASVPVDPVRRLNYQAQGLGVRVTTETGQMLHLSHFPSLSLDGQFLPQGQGGRVDFANRPLPKKGPKHREGFASSYVYADGVRVTATVTLMPTKPATKGAKRRLDAVLIHYAIENQSNKPHKVGLRVYMDTYVIDNDGCLFAAPTHPGKLLDGVILKGKTLPPYVQMLQRPDLKNPGFVTHLTLGFGSKWEKPDRVVLTRHGQGFNSWDMAAVASMGDSGLGIYWEPKELKPGQKREFAYGYGQGLVPNPEHEGQVELVLGGSFAPGKLFNLTAYVNDPAPGQSLALELPEGMALVDGPALQPVRASADGESPGVVYWRARVLRPGAFAVRVRSSTGVTQGKIVTVTQAKG